MSLKIFPQTDSNELNLEIKNVNPSLINSIRRVCLEDFETIAFNIDDYINSDLKVIKNTSSLHNEFLLNRMGLIPIHLKDIDSFDQNKFKFVLKKENKTNKVINVTSADIEVYNTETGKKEDPKQFFPPNSNNSYILINKLKPNPEIGEEIHIEGRASKHRSKKNARYQPGFITFSNKQDPKKVKLELEKYISEHKDSDKLENLKKTFELSLADRYFYTDENNVCNYFNVMVESIGIIKPEQILYNCISILYTKLDKFKNNINKIINENFDNDTIKIEKSLENMDSYKISIQDETHTLGNLIQVHSLLFFDRKMLPFIGYRNPHPLKNIIEFKLATETNSLEEINNIISVTCNNIMKVLESLKKDVEKIL